MTSERMSEANQTTMLMALQKELAEMKKVHEETTRRNEGEIRHLRKENQEMKKLVEGGPSVDPTNQVGRSFATAIGPQTEREPKNKVLTLEMDGESHLNKSLNTTETAMTGRRHPFTDFVIEAPLPDKWKRVNRDRYDGTTDPDEHMDAYTTHMILYTTDDAVLCRVFPTSLRCWWPSSTPSRLPIGPIT